MIFLSWVKSDWVLCITFKLTETDHDECCLFVSGVDHGECDDRFPGPLCGGHGGGSDRQVTDHFSR